MLDLILILGLFDSILKSDTAEINHSYLDNQIEISITNFDNEYNEYQDYLKQLEYEKKHTFNGEKDTEIARKINKYFNSTLKGKGEFLVNYSLEVGLDPYLAAAVMLQETGCYWTCSKLTRSCNNVGGQKGKPSCNGGSYRKFDTLEEGLKFTINKLAGYYKRGLKTPAQINPHYAMTKTWAPRVQKYIDKLKSA